MARSLNSAQLIGNVGNDPEVRSTTGGARVASFSLATTDTWKDRDGGKQEKTAWHRLVVWGKLADVVEQYVHKGDRLYVAGRIEYRQWQDKEGQTRYSTEINVRDLIMLGGKGGTGNGGAGGNAGAGDERITRQGRAGTGGNAGKASPAAQRNQKAVDDDFEDFPGALADEDDDLPF